MVENPTSEDSVSHKLTGTVVSILYCCNISIVLNHVKTVLNYVKTVLNHGKTVLNHVKIALNRESKNQIVGTEKYNSITRKDTAFPATKHQGRQIIAV